jgi:hypothetical protein
VINYLYAQFNHYSLPEKLENAVRIKLGEWEKENKIARVWRKDASVWTNEDEAKWLGWLDSVEVELSKIQNIKISLKILKPKDLPTFC